MTDFADPSSASLRLSNDERDRAVAELHSHAEQGRLSAEELQQRTAEARVAVTRGDLVPLFADLPGALHLDGQATENPPTAAPGVAAAPNSSSGYPSQWDRDRDRREPRTRWGLLLVSVMPFISVILFFLTGMVWGYQYSWLWFLLIPLTGALVYGIDGPRRR